MDLNAILATDVKGSVFPYLSGKGIVTGRTQEDEIAQMLERADALGMEVTRRHKNKDGSITLTFKDTNAK